MTVSEGEPVVKYRQFLAAILANLANFSMGTVIAWPSPVNYKLMNEATSPLGERFDEHAEELSWISSIISLGGLCSPFIAGYFTNKIGRKWTLLSSTFFLIVSFILLLTTKSMEQIYAARVIQGFGGGFVMTAIPMYCGEIATNDCRGTIGSLMQLFMVVGILYVYAIGPYVSYWTLQWACLVLPIIFAGTFLFMPDSPYYLIQKGKKSEAINALKFLRGQSDEGVQNEIAEIESSVEESQRNKGSIMDIFTNKGNLKALIICCALITFQQMSGIIAVLSNIQTIFANAGTSLDPAVSSILVGSVQVLSSGCTQLIADRLGRRTILLYSSGVMSIGLIFLGVFFYVSNTGHDTSAIDWLPVTSLMVYVISYFIGFGPLPWAVVGEIFPGNVKSIAASIISLNNWFLGFVVTKWYPALDELGAQYAFWIFGGLSMIAFAFVFTFLIETKGLSFKEIQEKLNE